MVTPPFFEDLAYKQTQKMPLKKTNPKNVRLGHLLVKDPEMSPIIKGHFGVV